MKAFHDLLRASVETLLKNEFKPSRTVILAFGFDEEISGYQVSSLLGRNSVNSRHTSGTRVRATWPPLSKLSMGKMALACWSTKGSNQGLDISQQFGHVRITLQPRAGVIAILVCSSYAGGIAPTRGAKTHLCVMNISGRAWRDGPSMQDRPLVMLSALKERGKMVRITRIIGSLTPR